MKHVDLYGRVRHAVLIEGMSRREAARVFGIDPRTVAKMLAFSVPPGYRRSQPVHRPKLDAFIGIIDQILAADKLVPKKQRHTSRRIFERLRDEFGFTGGITIVKDYIFAARRRQRETSASELKSVSFKHSRPASYRLCGVLAASPRYGCGDNRTGDVLWKRA